MKIAGGFVKRRNADNHFFGATKMPRRLELRQNHLHRALHRAEIFRHHLQRVAAQLRAAVRVRQQFGRGRAPAPPGCAPARRRLCARKLRVMSAKFCMFGPNTIALPSAPGSIGFCPPMAVRLLPTNTTVAARRKIAVRRSCSPADIPVSPAASWCVAKISLRQKNFTPRACSFCPTSAAALEMARHQHQKQFRKFRAQPLHHVRQQ